MPDGSDIIARLNTGVMRAKLATMPGHEADMRPALDELGSAIKVITQVLGRQAAQLAALRAGASTEDLHAAADSTIAAAASMMALASEATRLGIDGDDVLHATAVTKAAVRAVFDRAQAMKQTGHATDRIARIEAEADALHAAAEGWRKRAEAAEAAIGDARRQALEEAAALAERDADWSGFGKRDLEPWPTGPDDVRDYRLGIVAGRSIAAAIRALADKPAAGGADA